MREGDRFKVTANGELKIDSYYHNAAKKAYDSIINNPKFDGEHIVFSGGNEILLERKGDQKQNTKLFHVPTPKQVIEHQETLREDFYNELIQVVKEKLLNADMSRGCFLILTEREGVKVKWPSGISVANYCRSKLINDLEGWDVQNIEDSKLSGVDIAIKIKIPNLELIQEIKEAKS